MRWPTQRPKARRFTIAKRSSCRRERLVRSPMARRPTHPDVPNVGKLLAEIDRLLEAVVSGASARRAAWPQVGEEFEPSASNLAAYLALRQQDLRSLQDHLMVLGLSSLGRIEGRVVPALHAKSASPGRAARQSRMNAMTPRATPLILKV